MTVRGRAVAALWRVMLSRNARVSASIGVAVAVLVGLDAARHGVRLDSMLAWALGGSGMLAFAPAMGIVREKADGTLRFFAFLPIHGPEHAAARALTALCMALPTAVLLGIAVPVLAPDLPRGAALLAAASAWLVLAAASLLVSAVQLRSRIGQGLSIALFAFVAVMVAAQLISLTAGTGWLTRLGRLLATPPGMAVASVLLWAALAGAGLAALRTIAVESPRYRGEPPAQ